MFLEDFGGFNAAIYSIPALFMGYYAEHMFQSKLLEQIPIKQKQRSTGKNKLQQKFSSDVLQGLTLNNTDIACIKEEASHMTYLNESLWKKLLCFKSCS